MRARPSVVSIALVLLSSAAWSQKKGDLNAVEIKTNQVSKGVYIVEGAGGKLVEFIYGGLKPVNK